MITKSGQRLEGVVGSVSSPAATSPTSPSGDGEGITMKDVKDLTSAGAPLRETYFVSATNIESYTSGPADARPPVGPTDCELSFLHFVVAKSGPRGQVLPRGRTIPLSSFFMAVILVVRRGQPQSSI